MFGFGTLVVLKASLQNEVCRYSVNDRHFPQVSVKSCRKKS